MTVRALVIDDERPAREKIRRHLRADPDVEVVGEAATGLEAVDAIRKLSPDLVFLDVQMPGLDGFEALRAERTPVVVFVTAFDEYAIQAFEVEAADYLLKPFDQTRFEQALGRARRRLSSQSGTEAAGIDRLLERVQPLRGHLRRLVVDAGDRVLLVPIKDVTRLSAEGNYVRVHVAGSTYLIRDTLTRLDTRLDPNHFARIHRSTIVAFDTIVELRPWSHGDYEVVLRNGERVRLSRRYQDRVLNRDAPAAE